MNIACGNVQDLLIPLVEYPHIREDSSLRDAFVAIEQGLTTGKRFRHVLVLDDKDNLVGLMGMRDILRGIFPDYLRATLPGQSRDETTSLPQYPALALLWQDSFHTQSREAASKPVKPHMAPVTVTVSPSDPVTKAAYLMVFTDSSMLPVVENHSVVGVIRMVDVFNEASKVVLHG
ncbi:MAG: CBS domain-containing protein [Gammaproteobacteria bacterium]|nr:CBS domain-containing protein [Gammaproteobacteria bacterium]MBU1979951.1 CBS domain-containing protein [Gammaproteobacteria bacterium]